MTFVTTKPVPAYVNLLLAAGLGGLALIRFGPLQALVAAAIGYFLPTLYRSRFARDETYVFAALLTGGPAALALLIYLVTPTYFRPIGSSPAGWIAGGLFIVLAAVGYVIARSVFKGGRFPSSSANSTST